MMMLQMKRLLLKAAALALVLLAATTGSSLAQSTGQPLRVHIFPGNIVSLYSHLGVSKGFYKDAGLNVELVRIATGPQANAALAGGSIDVVLNSPDNMISFKERGQDPVAIVGHIVKPLFVLVARDPAAFPKAPQGYPAVTDDFAGKKIGVYGLGGSSDRFVKLLLSGANKPDNTVQFVPLGGPAQSLTALASNRVDAISDTFAVAVSAELAHIGKMLLDCSVSRCSDLIDTGGKMGQAYWVTKQFAIAHEDQVRAFNAAHRRIDAWVHDPANHAALREEIVKTVPAPPNVDPAQYYDAITRQVPKYFGTALDASALAAVRDAMVATGELQNKLSLDGMIWSGA